MAENDLNSRIVDHRNQKTDNVEVSFYNEGIKREDHPAYFFECGTFELWYQPVYDLETGAVVSNEVLLRWRDQEQQLHLPSKFIPILQKTSLLSRIDAWVVQESLVTLEENPQLYLSVNLTRESLQNWSLLENLRSSLQKRNIDPSRLSFEISENAIAHDFPKALKFLTELNTIGCPIILDDFANQKLSLAECEELPISMIKFDERFIQSLKNEAKSQVLAKAILCFCQSLSQVAIKFVTDEDTLKLVQNAGLTVIQGNYLTKASPTPKLSFWSGSSESSAIIQSSQKQSSPALYPSEDGLEQPKLWQRVLIGTAFFGISLAAVGISAIVIGYRTSKVIADSGIVNGRVLRLRSPIDGTIEAFYPRPGVQVQADQVLMKIGRSQEREQTILQLEGDVASKENQLLAAQNSLNFLQSRLRKQESEYEQIWEVENEINNKEVSRKVAALEKAQAEAESARLDYKRYQQLGEQGAVSQQVVDKAKVTLQVAQAEVRRVQEELNSTSTALRASQQRIAMNRYPSWGDSFVKESMQLRQQIQDQQTLIKTLTAEVNLAEKKLRQAQSQYSNNQMLEVKSPLNAIVYSTEREQGETINQSEKVMTLLDCSDLWAEAIISSEAAAKIDPQSPILVELPHYPEAVTGELNLIQAVSPLERTEQSKRLQVQALIPSIKPDLAGKPLSRVKVAIPPPPNYEQTEQFCGLGQPARLTFATQNQSWSKWLSQLSPQWLKDIFS